MKVTVYEIQLYCCKWNVTESTVCSFGCLSWVSASQEVNPTVLLQRWMERKHPSQMTLERYWLHWLAHSSMFSCPLSLVEIAILVLPRFYCSWVLPSFRDPQSLLTLLLDINQITAAGGVKWPNVQQMPWIPFHHSSSESFCPSGHVCLILPCLSWNSKCRFEDLVNFSTWLYFFFESYKKVTSVESLGCFHSFCSVVFYLTKCDASLVIKSLKAYVPAISIPFAFMIFSQGYQFLKKD